MAFLLTPATAKAGSKLFVELDYQTEAKLKGCPNEAAFREIVQGQLGYNPFRSGSEQRVVARASAGEPGIQGYVRWYDASGAEQGDRRLSSASDNCAAFVRELGFAVVVQIQFLQEAANTAAEKVDTASSETPAPTGESSGQPAQPSAAAPRSDARAQASAVVVTPNDSLRSAPSAPTRWQAAVGAGPGFSVGLGPQPAFLARGFVTVRRDQLALELGGDFSLPSRYSAEGQGFDLDVFRGSLAGCGFFGPASACLVNRWGRVFVSGFGVEVPRASSGLLAQLGPRIGLTGNVARPWKASFWVEALFSLTPWGVTLNEKELWRTPRLSLGLGADLALLFHDNP